MGRNKLGAAAERAVNAMDDFETYVARITENSGDLAGTEWGELTALTDRVAAAVINVQNEIPRAGDQADTILALNGGYTVATFGAAVADVQTAAAAFRIAFNALQLKNPAYDREIRENNMRVTNAPKDLLGADATALRTMPELLALREALRP